MEIDIITHTDEPRAKSILAGLPGTSTPNGFVVDADVRNISPMFDLIGSPRNPAPISSADVIRIAVGDEIGAAVKAHLLTSTSKQWSSLYASVAGVAAASGAFAESAIRAERAYVGEKIQAFKDSNDLKEFLVPVTVYATVSNEHDDDDYSSPDTTAMEYLCSSGDPQAVRLALDNMVSNYTAGGINLSSMRSNPNKDVVRVSDEPESAKDFAVDDDIVQPIAPPVAAPRTVILGAPGGVNLRALALSPHDAAAVTAQPQVLPLPQWAHFPGILAVQLEANVSICARTPEEARTVADLLSGFPDENIRARSLELQDVHAVDAQPLEIEAPAQHYSQRGG